MQHPSICVARLSGYYTLALMSNFVDTSLRMTALRLWTHCTHRTHYLRADLPCWPRHPLVSRVLTGLLLSVLVCADSPNTCTRERVLIHNVPCDYATRRPFVSLCRRAALNTLGPRVGHRNSVERKAKQERGRSWRPASYCWRAEW